MFYSSRQRITMFSAHIGSVGHKFHGGHFDRCPKGKPNGLSHVGIPNEPGHVQVLFQVSLK